MYCGDNRVKMSNAILFRDKVLLGNNVQLLFKYQELPNSDKSTSRRIREVESVF